MVPGLNIVCLYKFPGQNISEMEEPNGALENAYMEIYVLAAKDIWKEVEMWL